MRLGAVRAYDAKGRDIPARMEVSPDKTRIVVPAEGLGRASYPVTIDPEIGTDDFRISQMGPDGVPGYDGLLPTVAYNSVEDEYMVCWYGTDDGPGLAVGEREIFCQRLEADTGLEIGGDFRISDMGGLGDERFRAEQPAIVYNSARNEYLVCWDGDDNVNGLVDQEYEIFCQRLSATGASLGTNDFRVSDMGPNGDASYGASNPTVAYNSVDDEYLACWEGDDDTGGQVDGEFEIFCQRLEGATGAEIGTDFRISTMGGPGSTSYSAREPAAVYNPAQQEYLVCWQGNNTVVDGNPDEEIFCQRLEVGTGAEVGNDVRMSAMGGLDQAAFDAISPAIAYAPGLDEYLLCWSGDTNEGGLVDDENEIFCRRERDLLSTPRPRGRGLG